MADPVANHPAGGSAVEKLTSLRQYGTSPERRAPHKPLLVLLALAALAESGSSRLEFSGVEARLGSLIAEFGPSSRTNARQAAAYPFTRLRSDGVWVLDADVPMDRLATLSGVAGRLAPDVEAELLADPGLVGVVARAVVDAQFPPSLAEDVFLAVGLDPDSTVGAGSFGAGLERRRRSAAWRAAVLADWDGACAFCGYDGSLAGTPVGIEAAHIRWFNFGGPDDPDNGLALCSLHHKLLDRGAVGLTPGHEIVVSRQFRASTRAGRGVYELDGSRLQPRPGAALPAGGHIEWHLREVFHGPALRAG